MTILSRQIVGVRSSTGQHHSTLLDSNLSTLWIDSKPDAWIELDLGQTTQKFNELSVVFGDYINRCYQYSIFTSTDQVNWNKVLSSNSSKGVAFTVADFDTKEDRYVKLVIHENDSPQPTKAQVAFIEVLYDEDEKAEGTSEEIEPVALLHTGEPELPVSEEEFDKIGLKKLRETDPNGISAYFSEMEKDSTWFSAYEKHGYKSLPGIKVWRRECGFNKKPGSVNLELKLYVRVDDLLPSFDHIQASNPGIGDGLSIKLIGGPHNDSKDSAGCYIIHFPYLGGKKNNCQKERPHPNYSKNTIDTMMGLTQWVKTGKYVGLGAILEQVAPNEVKITALMDPSGLMPDGKPANNWGIVYEVVDKGQLGDDKNTRKVWTTPNGKLTQIRMDNVPKEADVKMVSLREIIPETVVIPGPCPPGQHRDDVTGLCVDDTIPPPVGDVDEHGIKMLHKTTGRFVEITTGNDHPNGQRYSKNHQFGNYMVIGYFTLGKGQDVMEHKTDGPNHGGCNAKSGGDVPSKFPIEDCCWAEVNISLKDRKGYKAGQFYISSEHPHPDNFDAPPEGKGKIFNIKPQQTIGYAACAWQDGEFRHLQGWVDTDPFNVDGTPKNGWELGIDLVDKGQLTTPKLAKRNVPSIAKNHVKNKSKGQVGLESEIRMNNATNHDTAIKWCRVYELAVPVV